MAKHPTAGDLSGSLLVAHPMMGDPNFRHTILYLSSHSPDQGALGFIINRPLGPAGAISEQLDELARLPVYEGGPVSKNQVILARLDWDEEAGGCRFEPFTEVPAHLISSPGEQMRVFLGYAGWAKNQLEAEIAQNAWLVMRPHPSIIKKPATEETWRQLMAGLGPMYRVLSAAPENPANN